MRVLDLFSGIGGFTIGLEKAGMTTVAFCEIDKFCQGVLKKWWPKVKIYEDISKLFAEGSPAKTLVLEESAPEYPGSVVVFGNTYATPFAWYSRNTQSWKTWQRCLITGWEPYVETWPRSGMIRNGIAYQLHTLALRIQGTEYGLSATPTAVMPIEKEDPISRVKILPSGRPRKLSKKGRDGSMNWCQEMLHKGLIPTPELCEYLMGYPTGHTDIKP